ncbi:MAG: Maf family protein [Thauera sp.]|jgi:septum formation protein|nr:Maf family protein [Thauera sp.]
MPEITSRIYLASQSPRRRDLLRQVGIQFDVLTFRGGERGQDADVDESPLPDEEVAHYVERIALTKACAGLKRLRWRKLITRPVLAADTTIELDGQIIGKPANSSEALDILQRLSGRSHRVLTAVAVSNGERTRSRLSVSTVKFGELSPLQIRQYVASGEPMDKAGAYGIQGKAAIFIEEIHGSHSGIVGLPLYETAQLLREFNYPL